MVEFVVYSDEPHLVDVNPMDDKTSDASVITDRRADFRTRVLKRDVTCVMTGDSARFCDECHILPHSKGDDVHVLRLLSRNVLTCSQAHL
jgi:hypothetical protein